VNCRCITPVCVKLSAFPASPEVITRGISNALMKLVRWPPLALVSPMTPTPAKANSLPVAAGGQAGAEYHRMHPLRCRVASNPSTVNAIE